jgi:hypothetical protein
MTAMLILNGVLMAMIVAGILTVLVWGIVTDRPWRDRVRVAHARHSPRPAAPERSRQALRRHEGASGLSA